MVFEIASGIIVAYVIGFVIELGAGLAFEKANAVSCASKIFGFIVVTIGIALALIVMILGIGG